MADKLRKILAGARAIKQCIQKVGEDIAPPQASGPQSVSLKARLKGLRVLVADHDDRVRRSAHGILGRFGCVVETAGDAQEAMTMARLSTYDAILADIRLPDVGGFEVMCNIWKATVGRVVLYLLDTSHPHNRPEDREITARLYGGDQADGIP